MHIVACTFIFRVVISYMPFHLKARCAWGISCEVKLFVRESKQEAKISLQIIISIPTHVFTTCVQINHFCNYRCKCLAWHLVKMTYSCIKDHRVIYSCICNLDLWLMSICMKMKMKNTFVSSIFNGIPKQMKM